jgi:hypothetical protein
LSASLSCCATNFPVAPRKTPHRFGRRGALLETEKH